MTTITITLPAPLHPFVERELAGRGLTDVGEYLIELVREAHACEQLEATLVDGLDSADHAYDDAFRAGLDADVERILGSAAGFR